MTTAIASILDNPRHPCVRGVVERNKLIEANIPLCYWKLKRVLQAHPEYREVPRELLDDAAMDGLMRAAELWEDDYGTKFSTYAVWAIGSRINHVAQQHFKRRDYCLLDVWGFEREDEDDRPFEFAAPSPHEESDRVDMLAKVMARLSEADQGMLHDKYGLGMTLHEMGRKWGRCPERIRQRLVRAVGQLRREWRRMEVGR